MKRHYWREKDRFFFSGSFFTTLTYHTTQNSLLMDLPHSTSKELLLCTCLQERPNVNVCSSLLHGVSFVGLGSLIEETVETKPVVRFYPFLLHCVRHILLYYLVLSRWKKLCCELMNKNLFRKWYVVF